MKLVRCSDCYTYQSHNKLSQFELLSFYNPYHISRRIKYTETQIEEMYYLSVSHVTTSEVHGVVTVGCPVDKLVFWIVEQKDALRAYKSKSEQRMKQLKRVMDTYTPLEQKQIKQFMFSNGNTVAYDVIERLQIDLYQSTKKARQNRNRERMEARERGRQAHAAKLRQSLQEAI